MAVASDLPQLENRAEFKPRAELAAHRRPRRLPRDARRPGPDHHPDARHRARDAARDHRDRGPALLREPGRRPARHGARAVAGRHEPAPRSRAARRSRSSSSRTRPAPRTTARCSRRCARPRSPTTSRASGPRRRSSPSTSTRSTSATAPTGSSPPRARTSATTSTTAAAASPSGAARASSSPRRRPCSPGSSRRRRRSTRSPTTTPRSAGATSSWRRCSSRATSRARVRSRAPRAGPVERRRSARRRSRPRRKSVAYFTSWVRQQVVDRYGAARGAAGRPARADDARPRPPARRRARDQPLARQPRRAAGVARRDRQQDAARSGRWSAGTDYSKAPFNLATQGQRQPGSAFKPFVLATALQRGISPSSTWSSKRQVFNVPGSTEKFRVNNYDDNYSGVSTLARATTFSDNSVYAQVGIKTGTTRIARTAERMGIRTPVSQQLRHHARRPEAGRDADGPRPRLPDVRDGRAARHRHRSAPASTGPSASAA